MCPPAMLRLVLAETGPSTFERQSLKSVVCSAWFGATTSDPGDEKQAVSNQSNRPSSSSQHLSSIDQLQIMHLIEVSLIIPLVRGADDGEKSRTGTAR